MFELNDFVQPCPFAAFDQASQLPFFWTPLYAGQRRLVASRLKDASTVGTQSPMLLPQPCSAFSYHSRCFVVAALQHHGYCCVDALIRGHTSI